MKNFNFVKTRRLKRVPKKQSFSFSKKDLSARYSCPECVIYRESTEKPWEAPFWLNLSRQNDCVDSRTCTIHKDCMGHQHLAHQEPINDDDMPSLSEIDENLLIDTNRERYNQLAPLKPLPTERISEPMAKQFPVFTRKHNRLICELLHRPY